MGYGICERNVLQPRAGESIVTDIVEARKLAVAKGVDGCACKNTILQPLQFVGQVNVPDGLATLEGIGADGGGIG